MAQSLDEDWKIESRPIFAIRQHSVVNPGLFQLGIFILNEVK